MGNPAVKFSDISEQTQRVPDDSSTPAAYHANLNIQCGLQSQGKVHGHSMGSYSEDRIILCGSMAEGFRAQELCESRGGRPGLSVLTSLMVSVDVKQY